MKDCKGIDLVVGDVISVIDYTTKRDTKTLAKISKIKTYDKQLRATLIWENGEESFFSYRGKELSKIELEDLI